MSSCALLLCHAGLYGHPNERKARGNNVGNGTCYYNSTKDTNPKIECTTCILPVHAAHFLGGKMGEEGGDSSTQGPLPPRQPSVIDGGKEGEKEG